MPFELAHDRAGLDIPQSRQFVEAAGQDLLAVRRKRYALDLLRMVGEDMELAPGPDIPQPRRFVEAAGKELGASAGSREHPDPSGVADEPAQLLPASRIPQSRGLIRHAPGNDVRPIRRERDGIDRAVVTGKAAQLMAGADIP